MDNVSRYFAQGRYYLVSAIIISVIIYLGILGAIYIVNKSKKIKERTYSLKQGIIGYLLVLYTITILKITGIIGMTFNFSWFIEAVENFELSIPLAGSSALMVILNMLLFIPFGVLISVLVEGMRLNWKRLLLMGFIFSFSIEFLQLFGGRFFEVDDLIANSVGTMLGYLIYQVFDEIKARATRKKAILKGISILIALAIMIISIVIVANGDRVQAERNAMYSDMGMNEAEISDLYSIWIYDNESKREIEDCSYIYASVGMNISNRAYCYFQDSIDRNIEEIMTNTTEQYLEILFNNEHTFKFYNKQELVLENIKHILYNLNDGTVYFGTDSSDSFSQVLRYESEEYPFEIDEMLNEELAEVK